MRHLGLIALINVGLALASTGGARAASETFTCPADARGQVSYTGSDSGWVATTQSSPLVGLSIETIAGQTSLVCHYRMFGGDSHHRGMMPGMDGQMPGRGNRMMPGNQAPAAPTETPEANS